MTRHYALPKMLCVLSRDMWCEEEFFPAPSLFCCTPAAMLMPFVCAGSTGAVTIIAFLRESHNDYLHFHSQDNPGGEVCLWREHRGEPAPAWRRRAEVRTAVSLCHSVAATCSQGDQQAPPGSAAWLRFRGVR